MQDLRTANSRFIRNIECTLRLTMVTLAMVCVARPMIPEGQHSITGPQMRSPFGDTSDPVFTKRQLSMLNVQRQKKMVSEADKLLALARELNSEIGSANSNSLAVDQIRKLEEIEKLAKSVKAKMTLTVGGEPVMPTPMIP